MSPRSIRYGTDLSDYGEVDLECGPPDMRDWFAKLTLTQREFARKFPPLSLVRTDDADEGDSLGVVNGYTAAGLIIFFDVEPEGKRMEVSTDNLVLVKCWGQQTPEWVAKMLADA